MTVKETFVENLSKIKGETTNYEIAEIMQCSTGTMSKYLNVEKYPNLMPSIESLVLLCKHFHVTVDWLIGADTTNSDTANNEMGIKKLCRTFSMLLENDHCLFKPVTITEDCWEFVEDIYDPICSGYVRKKKKNTYNAILFPDYAQPKSEEEYMIVEQVGNENCRNKKINTFLRKMINAYNFLKEKGMEREMYNDLLEKYISDLPDE